jgi:molybdenum-dependent DNA-binding transcriptional regulator ModE
MKQGKRLSLVDTHPDREKILKDIVNRRGTLAAIAKRYDVSYRAVWYYVQGSMKKLYQGGAQQTSLQTAEGIIAKCEEAVEQLTMLAKACDEWMRDPDDPTKYTMDTQASDCEIVYTEEEEGGDGRAKKVRKRATLQELIATHVPSAFQVVVRRDDPRRLFVEIHKAVGEELDRLAKLIGAIKDAKVDMSKTVVFNFFWSDISKALEAFPEAREALAAKFEEKAQEEQHGG